MYYFSFNIGDYLSHTQHLELLEDLAYRRMLDWCYLHEKPLPKDQEEIAKLIRMRTHSDCIAYVLQEFFILSNDGYSNARIDSEIASFQSKSEKAKASAKARWDKNKNKNKGLKDDAKAMRTQSEGNAKQETRNKKQKPFIKPLPEEVEKYMKTYTTDKKKQVNNLELESEKFVDFYTAKDWMVGKNKMKDWKASVRNWFRNDESSYTPKEQSAPRQEEFRR